MPSKTVLPVVLLVLQLRIDLLSSFTVAPSCTRTIATHGRQWRVLPKRVEEENQRHPWTLSMSNRRRRTNRDSYYDDEDEDEDYYYQDRARDYDDDYRDDRDADKDEDEDDYYNSTAYYTNNGNTNSNKNTSKNREGSSRRSQYNYYDDDGDEKDDSEDDDEALEDYPEDNYDDDSARSRSSSSSDASRGGYYQVSFTNNNDVDYSETEIDWEVCGNPGRNKKFPPALVVLPPAAVDRPKAIVHFVGGTVFGSNPRLWYGGLLESIVRSTSVAIVVTPVPVTLFRNPLQHVRLSNALAESLEHAWETVLEDEYGASSLEGVPLCGVGHSLGARLLTVLTTLDRNDPDPPVPAYKSLCLISFTNYGAKVGIPGVGALLKQSQKREAYNNNNNRNKNRNNNNRNNNRKRGGAQPSSRHGRGSSRARTRSRTGYDYDYDYDYDDDDYYDDLDEEWAEMVEELQETVNAQANRIQSALTPNPNQLEFFPTPDQLWRAVSSAEGDRYRVNTTLVVQFDDDPIDQGSKLATILAEGNATDVRFARLRGNHLTPVTVREEADANGNARANGNGNGNSGFAGGATPRRQTKKNPLLVDAGLQSVLAKTFRGTQTARRDKVALRDLKRSLVSYITDVVIK